MLELEIVQGATPRCTNPTLSSVQDTLKNSYSVGQYVSIQCRKQFKYTYCSPQLSSKVQKAIQFDGELASIDVLPSSRTSAKLGTNTHGCDWMQQPMVQFHFVPFLPPGDIHVQVQATSKTSTMKTNII